MARLAVCLLGPFRVTLDERPVAAFESDKVRALLAYLAVEAGVPHRREKLAGLLWPDWPEQAARANLSRALTNLRHTIGEHAAVSPILHTSRQAIEFVPGEDAWVDVTAFESGVQQAGAVPHEDECAVLRLTAAVDLYRGPFLDGFCLPGCPEFEEWALFEGEHLQRLALLALDRLSKWYERGGQTELALQYAWREVELAPWQERAHQRLMRLLVRAGQRAAAMAQYEACRRHLADELGAKPSAETVALYEQLREAAAPVPRPAPVHNLRAPLTPFVGRAGELADLGDRLRDPTCRLMTLLGPGGIGKTRLAVEAARIHLGHFPDGVFQVRLAGLRSASAIVPAIAETIGFSFHRHGDAKQQLLNYLSNKTMLLVLDNFEHLLDGVEVVIDLLQAAPGIKALITSRTRLHLQGENLFLVEGLTETDATELFSGGARRICPAFQLADHAASAARICRLLDGTPLAILLAASWAGSLSPAAIEARLAQGLGFLEAPWRDVPARHRSMRATFDHSWRLLPPRDRELFQRLSVFRGSFTPHAARQVAGASSSELRALVDRSLLHQLPTGRFEVHELLRQYGAEKLAAVPGLWEGAHESHCAHYLAAQQRCAEALKGVLDQAALAEMDLAMDNTSAAWSWAAERQQVGRLGQALEGLCLFYDWRGRYAEGEAACQLAARKLATGAQGPGVRLLSRLLAWQGTFDRLLERRDEAAELLARSEDLLEHPALTGQDVRWERAFLLFQRGHLALHADREGAGALQDQSAALFRAAGQDWWAAAALREQGRVAYYRGSLAEGRRLLEESLTIRRSLGDERGTADCLDGLGIVAMFQGRLEVAEQLARESISILGARGSRWDYAGALGNLGTILGVAGKLDEGCSALEEAITIETDLGQNWALAHDRAMLAIVETWRGRYEQALAQSDMACALSREVRYLRGEGHACWVRGAVALVQGAYAPAWQWLRADATLMHRIDQRDEVGIALSLLGLAASRLGHPSRARHFLRTALRMAAANGSFTIVLMALPAVAAVLADEGQAARALELYALAKARIPLVSRSPWHRDIAGGAIAAVAAGLPPGLAAAAEARGRLRDLWATVAELAEELA